MMSGLVPSRTIAMLPKERTPRCGPSKQGTLSCLVGCGGLGHYDEWCLTLFLVLLFPFIAPYFGILKPPCYLGDDGLVHKVKFKPCSVCYVKVYREWNLKTHHYSSKVLFTCRKSTTGRLVYSVWIVNCGPIMITLCERPLRWVRLRFALTMGTD